MLTTTPGGTLVTAWVVPGASRTEVVGVHGSAVRVRVAAPAQGGRANEAMLRLLSDLTGARCELRRGAGSRRKEVFVAGKAPREVAGLLGIEWPGKSEESA